MPTGDLLLRTPGPIPLGLAYVLLVEINLFSELVVIFRTMLFEYPSVLSRFCLLQRKYSEYELWGAAVAEWLSSWLAEQEDRGSIPGLATRIFSCFQVEIWLKDR